MTVDWINFVDLMMLLSSTMNRSIIILFTCLGWIAFYLLRELAEVIARTRQNIVLSADFNVETELKRWRRRYDLICKYIDRINSCFGFILIIEMIKGFVTFITFAFDLIVEFPTMNFNETENIGLIIIPILGWCYVIAIVTVCNAIRTQVLQRNLATFKFRIAVNVRIVSSGKPNHHGAPSTPLLAKFNSISGDKLNERSLHRI